MAPLRCLSLVLCGSIAAFGADNSSCLRTLRLPNLFFWGGSKFKTIVLNLKPFFFWGGGGSSCSLVGIGKCDLSILWLIGVVRLPKPHSPKPSPLGPKLASVLWLIGVVRTQTEAAGSEGECEPQSLLQAQSRKFSNTRPTRT